MDKFLVSMMRFSTAMTLFGLEQMQVAASSMGSGQDMAASMDRLRKAMDSFSDAVMGEVDNSKKETVDTVTRVSEDTVHRAFSGVSGSMVDPREMIRVTTDMMKRGSDSVMDWMDEGASSGESPQKASDALSGSKKGPAPKTQVS